MRASLLAVCASVLLLGTQSGCESPADKAAEHSLAQAADVTTCRAQAKPVSAPYASGFPPTWTFPPRTTVYHAEDSGQEGTIVTAITSTPFKGVLGYLNHDAVHAGFAITEGETEAHDAEANWTGHGFRGRWAIRESSQCPGETVVQVLAVKRG